MTKPTFIQNPAYGIYSDGQEESYQDRSSGQPRLDRGPARGLSTVTCPACNVSFSLTKQRRLRPRELECPFCFKTIAEFSEGRPTC